MRIMIVGGGKVGYYLAKTLASEGHVIMLVEQDRAHCQRIAEELDTKYIGVTCGDGTAVGILREAGIGRADALIAVTGQDQNNLAACQLAKEYFGVRMTVSRVNNPKNIRVFEELGVDSVISSTARITSIINQELDWSDVNRIFRAKAGNVRIREAMIEPGCRFCGKRLAELGLPQGMIVLAVVRGEETGIPNGDTRLLEGDNVIVMGKEPELTAVLKDCAHSERGR